ncbi:MAG: diguanylate cyclase [Cyanobacteria bacterium]|nr:diguanylate cyclase [Cyanobacteriota bacterium]
MRVYGLSWYYLVDAKGKLTAQTIPYAPNTPRMSLISEYTDAGGTKIYDAVVATPAGNLHLGFYSGAHNLMGRLSEGTLARTIPVGYALMTLFAALGLVGIIETNFNNRPLERITKAVGLLFDGDEPEFKEALAVGTATPVIRKLVSALKDLRAQYNRESYSRIKTENELRRGIQEVERESDRLSEEYKQHLFHTSQDLSERASKEAEEEFLKALGRDLDRFDSANDIAQMILDKLSNKYPQTIRSCIACTFDKQGRLTIPAFISFDERELHALKEVDFNMALETMFARRNPLFIPNDCFLQYGLATKPVINQFESLVFLPLSFENRKLGFIMIPLTASGRSAHEKTRVMKNVAELASRSLHRVTVLQEELQSARTDPLTGLYNKKFLFELVLQLQDRAGVLPEDHPITFLMIDGDHFKDINDTYGHLAGDEVLRKLAEIIRQNTRMREGTGGRYKDYVIRYGGEEFLVVLENTTAHNAQVVAQRIKEAVENEGSWPEGIMDFTVSQGLAAFPADARDFEDLLKKADTALYYVKQQLNRNNICAWSDVPQSYRVSIQHSTVGGELGLFDATGLLQSIASTQKTGVLTVKSSDNKQFWILYDEGRAIQARLGKYRGYDAVIEFIAAFTEGTFQFQERNKTGTGRLPKLHETFDLKKSLDRMLMDGVLAVDNMNRAKTLIDSPDSILVPTPGRKLKYDLMLESKEPPTKKELAVIDQMLDLMNEDSSLQAVFDLIDDIPTPILWHCAGLIIQGNLATVKEVNENPRLLGSLIAKSRSEEEAKAELPG